MESIKPSSPEIGNTETLPENNDLLIVTDLKDDTDSKTLKKREPNYKIMAKKIDVLIKRCDRAIEKKSETGGSGVSLVKSIKNELVNISNLNKKYYPKPKKSLKQNSEVIPHKINGFTNKLRISEEMASFPGVDKDATFSRTEITTAICVYINRNKDEKRESHQRWAYLNSDENGNPKRDLRDKEQKKNVVLDDTLNKLLRFDDFVTRIKNGEVNKFVFDKERNEYMSVPETDTHFYYKTIQQLIGVHIVQ